MGRRDFQEHKVMLFLSKELYVAFIKLQADKGLGRSYAALLPFVEGLRAMGYISEDVYESHKKKYSTPLLVQKTLPEALDTQAEQLNKTMGMVADQWATHLNPEWRRGWLETARAHSELSNAKLILALEEEAISNE
jgi:hypothetical protein